MEDSHPASGSCKGLALSAAWWSQSRSWGSPSVQGTGTGSGPPPSLCLPTMDLNQLVTPDRFDAQNNNQHTVLNYTGLLVCWPYTRMETDERWLSDFNHLQLLRNTFFQWVLLNCKGLVYVWTVFDFMFSSLQLLLSCKINPQCTDAQVIKHFACFSELNRPLLTLNQSRCSFCATVGCRAPFK